MLPTGAHHNVPNARLPSHHNTHHRHRAFHRSRLGGIQFIITPGLAARSLSLGRVCEVTVSGTSTVDTMRSALATAMGHPGCRARVHLSGTQFGGGELSGPGAVRDCGYTEVVPGRYCPPATSSNAF